MAQYSQGSDRDEKLIEASFSEYSVTDSDRIGPVQIGEVTGPVPVHLRPDRLITSYSFSEDTVMGTHLCLSIIWVSPVLLRRASSLFCVGVQQ